MPTTRRTSLSWLLSTLLSRPSSGTREMAALGSTGRTSTPPASSRGSSSYTTTASTGGFLMGNFALQYQTDPTTFIGFKILSHQTSFQRIIPMKRLSEVLI
uniref:Methyltransferase-like protein n=1 Tax=Rhizophora mucronata TaxID=61149 RepID=A0A2P2JCH6_RHIMU